MWNHKTQIEYQIRLIQQRLYGYGKHQFYNDLSSGQIKLVNDINHSITYTEAEAIFHAKHYKDPPMRGRQSVNPLKKFGFAVAEKNRPIAITEFGHRFLEDTYDSQDIFLRILLKWQIPNPDNRRFFDSDAIYDIKPFTGTLHLIHRVNSLEHERGGRPRGVSKREFCLFVPTLVHHRDIEARARMIISTREELADLPQVHHEAKEREIVTNLLAMDGNDTATIDKQLNDLADYGDNAIRYFRLTAYIHIRSDGFHIDLEPRRLVEINALLASDNGSALRFPSRSEFLSHISDPQLPTLPWDERSAQLDILRQLAEEIHDYERKLNLSHAEIVDLASLNAAALKELIIRYRVRVRRLRNEYLYQTAQLPTSIASCISVLNSIYQYERRPLLLEQMASLGLCALDDAISINPNYPVGDDNKPTFTAPANVPDIECFYETFNATCEVTMLTSRDQWYHEGQPVMRHLRDFEGRYPDKPAYCLFIAPRLHRDTANTFWAHIKLGYEGKPSRIVPLSIQQFSNILGTIRELRLANISFPHVRLRQLFDNVLQLPDTLPDSQKWLSAIPTTIESWQNELIQ